ncbi:hypothetical protein Dda_2445 [Drechslerella dactyloides]|uniref:NAD-dependent epimerase/dehydratase domain-containing protein n=1 Tax=Drechslerella dactyloides TaxID=74499 RepID=A0AAD6J0F3_DREDA|nr:hypothetical protein Dda_2445 [Drechslerella dactyloides]
MSSVGATDVPITVPKLKVFLTGGTGYIGGAVLTALLRSPDLSITTLVRSESYIETLTSPSSNPKFFSGSTPTCVLGSLSDSDLLRKHASISDIVVNCASADDVTAVDALIEGLADSPESSKKIFIHTSGTSGFATWNNGDEGGRPISDTEDLVKLMKEMNDKETYGHRTAALRAIELGKSKNVKTFIIVPPTIYGETAAIIPRLSVQIPYIIRTAIKTKKAHYIGSGNAVWSNVHITDLTKLYEIVLRCALSGVAKHGEEGVFFAANGERSWKDIATGVKAAVEAIPGWQGGEIALESWTDEEAAHALYTGNVQLARLGSGSNVITLPTRGLQLGWKPAFGEDAVMESMKKDAEILYKEIKSAQP